MALEDAIEKMAASFADHNLPFDIEVALFGLSYRFPAMTRSEIREAVVDVLGARATPPKRPMKVVSNLPKKHSPLIGQQITWERKAG